MIRRRFKFQILAASAVFGAGMLFAPPATFAQTPSSAAAQEIRFQELEKEIRRLTSQVEEQGYEIRRLKDELAQKTGDLEVRMNDLAGGGNAGATGAPYTARPDMEDDGDLQDNDLGEPPSKDVINKTQSNSSFQYTPSNGENTLGTIQKSTDSGAVSSVPNDPAQAYDYAYSFITSRDFPRAEREFAAFMQKFPDHALASNAKYWYGETFYVRGSYEKAARIFAEGYQQYPKGPKAASNMLKLGMSLVGMEKTDDACVAFKQLKREYKNASAPVLNRAEKEMARINCR